MSLHWIYARGIELRLRADRGFYIVKSPMNICGGRLFIGLKMKGNAALYEHHFIDIPILHVRH